MSRLALGTAQFGLPYGIANSNGQVSRLIAKDMLALAQLRGIDTLDTAIAYGDSESCLGEVGGKNFNVVTKLHALPASCADVCSWVQFQMDQSLARLGTNRVYGLLLHRSEQLLGTHGKALYESLQRLKETGRVQKIGVSVYSPDEFQALIPKYQFDLVQAPLNLVDQRLHKSGWLKRLKDDGIEIHTRSAFLQGLLLMPHLAIPMKFAQWADLWSKWHNWLSSHDVSAVQACLKFPLSFSEIDRVVIGADSTSQLEQIVDAEVCVSLVELPDLHCASEALVNPSHWNFI